jgi:hypothetical protein
MNEKKIMLCGEVRSLEEKKKKADQSLYARQYQIEIQTGKSKVGTVIFVDHDLSRKFEVGKFIPAIDVRAEINDFQGLHIEFHSLGNGNGSGNAAVDQTAVAKEKPGVKV